MATADVSQGEKLKRSGEAGLWLHLAGCLTPLAAGVGLAMAQQSNIAHGWSACWSQPYDFEAGGRFALTVEAMARLVGYPIALWIAAWTGWGAGRLLRHATLGFWLMLAIGALLMFWLDYRHNNYLDLQDWRARCPSGHPPGWPSWLPLRLTR